MRVFAARGVGCVSLFLSQPPCGALSTSGIIPEPSRENTCSGCDKWPARTLLVALCRCADHGMQCARSVYKQARHLLVAVLVPAGEHECVRVCVYVRMCVCKRSDEGGSHWPSTATLATASRQTELAVEAVVIISTAGPAQLEARRTKKAYGSVGQTRQVGWRCFFPELRGQRRGSGVTQRSGIAQDGRRHPVSVRSHAKQVACACCSR